MCGIAGILSLDEKPIANLQARSKKIIENLKHRGPDGFGTWTNLKKNILICNTRLAIVDPQKKIQLPFTDNKVDILGFNGEVYNYKLQKKKFVNQGVRFKTATDTEVLYYGLKYEGKKFLNKVDGMWALAFYNDKKKKLLLSRDLLGEKHIFYCVHKNYFIFASEMNCLLSQIDGSIDYDFESIKSAFQYRSCQPGKTLIKNVSKMLPGSIIEIENGNIKKSRFLKIQPQGWLEKISKLKNDDEVLDLYDEQISDAVRSRVPSDIDFSSTLSGGVDSTLLNFYLSKNNLTPKFCLHGISDNSGDGNEERRLSENTAKTLNFNLKKFDLHNEYTVKNYIQQCSNSFDGIFCEGSVGFRQLSHYTNKNNLKVLLLSDGADEFLTGYSSDISNHFLMSNKFLKKLSFLKKKVRNSKLSYFLYKFGKNNILNWSFCDENFSFRPINGGTAEYELEKIFDGNMFINEKQIFGKVHSDYFGLFDKLDFSQKTSLSYATSVTPDYFNLRTDRASHFHSVEFRLPFQKKSLVELMIATPSSYRFKNIKTGKYILRKLLERYAGKRIAWKKKVGFYFPAWWKKEFQEKMKMREVIGDSDIFKIPIFKTGAKEFILSKKTPRLFWFSYCLAMTNLKLNSRIFDVDYSPI